MQPTKLLNGLLLVSGLIAFAIGASILLDPASFHAGHGIELGTDASLLSEVRAPGGALLALGALMGVGAFVTSLRFTSTVVAAVVYLAYGLSRLVSLGLDGMPAAGLVTAAAVELAIGAACVVALVRSTRRVERAARIGGAA